HAALRRAIFLRDPDSGSRDRLVPDKPSHRAPESTDPGAFVGSGAGWPGGDEETVTTETEQPTEHDIDELRAEVDHLDAEILRLAKRRVEVSRKIGAARMAAGGPRIVYNREMDVLARYRELGPDGRQLALALLNLGRGRLGR